MTEPTTEELLATVREAIDEACVHDTDHAGAYPALDTLAARLEAAGRQHVDDLIVVNNALKRAEAAEREVERLRGSQ